MIDEGLRLAWTAKNIEDLEKVARAIFEALERAEKRGATTCRISCRRSEGFYGALRKVFLAESVEMLQRSAQDGDVDVTRRCDHPGCTRRIERAATFACGGRHGSGDAYCAGYFCFQHLRLSFGDRSFACFECDVAARMERNMA